MQSQNVDRDMVIDPTRRGRIEEGDQAAADLSRGPSFYKWLAVGVAVNEMQAIAMERAGSQDIQSHAYRVTWRALAVAFPHIAELSKSERSRASWMATNREAVVGWHNRLDDKKRRNINTPQAVWQNHPLGRAAREREPVRSPRREPASREDLTQAVGLIAEEIGRVSSSVAPYDLSTPELVSASVETCIAQYGVPTARAFATALLRATQPATPTEPPVADPAFTQSLGKPKRRRGTKSLDDPTRPRNRVAAS